MACCKYRYPCSVLKKKQANLHNVLRKYERNTNFYLAKFCSKLSEKVEKNAYKRMRVKRSQISCKNCLNLHGKNHFYSSSVTLKT